MAQKANTLAQTVLNGTSNTSNTLIFLHGLGGTGANYENLVKPIAPMFPHIKFILPSAPVCHVTFSNTSMPSWYDIKGFSPEFDEDDEGVKASAAMIHEIIDAEIKRGVPSEKILIAGGSQGGAMALYSALTYPKNLAGVVAISTYLPLNKTFPYLKECNKDTPILMCHGEDDQIVPFKYGKLSYELLKQHHTNINFKAYPGVGHSASPLEMIDIVGFISRLLTPVTVSNKQTK